MHVVHQHDTTCYTGPRHDTNTYHTMARYQAIPMHVILLHDTNCNAHNIPWYQCMACMHMVLMHVTLYGMVYVPCMSHYGKEKMHV